MKMQVQSLVLIFSLCISKGWASINFDIALSQILSRPNGTIRDETTFYNCFNYYTGIINEAQKRFEAKHKECESYADTAIAVADDNTDKLRKDLYSRISASCNSKLACRYEKQAVAEFDCIGNEAAAMSRKLSEISNEASLHRQELEQKHKLVLHNREVCVKTSEDALQKETNEILEKWDRCNAGLITVPNKLR